MQTLNFFIFPIYAKYLGFLIIIISAVMIILQALSGIKIFDFFNPNADIKTFAIYAMMILGNVLITFSKEKIEDEYVNLIRLKSFLLSIAIHSAFFFVFSFTNLTLSLINFPAIILMNSLLLAYIISFYFQKMRITQNRSRL